MRLRLAREHDLEAMVGLLGILFEQEAEFEPSPDAQRRGLISVLGSGDRARLLVAEDAGAVVAMVSLLYQPSTALGATVAMLEDLVVHPDHRGRGIGRSLLDYAVARSREDGCARVTLLTDRDNTRAHALYERAGFSRSPMTAFRLASSSRAP